MRASQTAYDLIKHFEGFRADAYICPAGKWTIGYGNTTWEDGRPVQVGDEIDAFHAEKLLRHHVEAQVAPAIERLYTTPLKQHEFDALVSWVFNFGASKTETQPQRARINDRVDPDEIARFWVQYRNKGSDFEEGLYRRRLAELCVWRGYQWEAACSPNIVKLESDTRTSDWRYVLARAKRDGPLATANPPPKPTPKPDPALPPPAPQPEAVSVEEEPVTTLPGKPPGYTTKQPTQVAYKIDPEAGLKSLDESDRARGYLWQQIGRGVIRAGGLGMFGNIFAGGFQIIGQDAVLTEMMLALFVPAALAASALIGGYVIERYGDWKRAKGEREAVQGLY